MQASDILQFSFSPTLFRQSADKIIPSTVASQIVNRILQLNIIVQKLGNSSFAFDDDTLKIRTFRKFKSGVSGNSTTFSKRELRALIYGLDYSEGNAHSIFDSENEFGIFLNTLNLNWRDTYLDGLILFLLKNWESNSKISLIELSEFVNSKLNEYKGKRTTLIAFKSNLKYFDLKNGDLILGKELALKNKPVSEAPAYLSLTDTWFTFTYFSGVIVAHYENKQNELATLIDDYDFILEIHKNFNTNKRIISKFIIQANKPENALLQDKVKHLAFKFIGDPENKSVWADVYNATEKEKSEIINARKILNEWITRQFINVFFNVCINDDRRKRFWLKYADKVSSFKVYGPSFTKTLLKRDENISKVIDGRFETVYSNRNVSAFILYIGEYMLMEFSDAGYAFYAYKINGNARPSLNYKLNSVDELRNGSMPMLIQNDYHYYDEGRLRHHDGNEIWESKFNRWITNKVIR